MKKLMYSLFIIYIFSILAFNLYHLNTVEISQTETEIINVLQRISNKSSEIELPPTKNRFVLLKDSLKADFLAFFTQQLQSKSYLTVNVSDRYIVSCIDDSIYTVKFTRWWLPEIYRYSTNKRITSKGDLLLVDNVAPYLIHGFKDVRINRLHDYYVDWYMIIPYINYFEFSELDTIYKKNNQIKSEEDLLNKVNELKQDFLSLINKKGPS